MSAREHEKDITVTVPMTRYKELLRAEAAKAAVTTELRMWRDGQSSTDADALLFLMHSVKVWSL